MQFYGCPASEGSVVKISGLAGSNTPDMSTMLIRGLGVINAAPFISGTLAVQIWSPDGPFYDLSIEFDLINPSKEQLPQSILVAVSDSDIRIPATKAYGQVLSGSQPASTVAISSSDSVSQVCAFHMKVFASRIQSY